MRDLAFYGSFAMACGAGGVILWIWGPGQSWWRSHPLEKRLRWVLNAQLGLLGAAFLLAIPWWPQIFLVVLLLGAVRVTGKELRLELNHQRIGRALDTLESSGEVDPQAMKEVRETIDCIHGVGS